MQRIDTLIIGAGQAGLAMSQSLTSLGVEHVVLERGDVAERWRSERWPALRLLTPAWQTRLPGHRYTGRAPESFLAMPDVIAMLDGYARSRSLPVLARRTVLDVAPAGGGYVVHTSRETWRARTVVIATGYCDAPLLPDAARDVPCNIHQVVPADYRGAASLPGGAVLVVGASSTGVQIADDLIRAGRQVVIAVGRHLRMPRRYRGRDVLAWMEAMGLLRQRIDDTASPDAARRQPSLQLVGDVAPRTLDLGVLHDHGALVVGRLSGFNGTIARFDDDLLATTVAADAKLAMLLARIDAFIACQRRTVVAAEPFAPLWPRFVDAPRELDLCAHGVSTIVWATGYTRRYPWLRVDGALDWRGDLAHIGGLLRPTGLYTIGMQFQRRRNSAFIDGVGLDAQEIAQHIAAGLRALPHPLMQGVAS